MNKVVCAVIFAMICILARFPDRALAQDGAQPDSTKPAQKLGPVGEQESKPSTATLPVATVLDPGVIPSRQAITPAGLESIFESRVYGVAFDENGDSIYALTVGQKGSFVYQINLKTNHVLNVVVAAAMPGMQGLTYDPVSRMALMSGLAGSGKKKES